jgi:hypothetical protein
MAQITAKLVGETSAGGLSVAIYDDGELVWSHDYFASGATGDEYRERLRDVYADAVMAEEWRQFDGGDRDDDGDPIDPEATPTAIVTLTWSPSDGWTWLAHDGISADFVCVNAGRLPAGIVASQMRALV